MTAWTQLEGEKRGKVSLLRATSEKSRRPRGKNKVLTKMMDTPDNVFTRWEVKVA